MNVFLSLILTLSLQRSFAIFSAKLSSISYPSKTMLKSPAWHAPTFNWGPQKFNITGPIYLIPKDVACSPMKIRSLENFVVMVMGFQGCSYEKTMNNLQKLNPRCVVFMSKLTNAAGVEAFIIDGTSTSGFSTPTVGLAIPSFVAVAKAWVVASKQNQTMIANVISDVNPFTKLFDSPATTLHQIFLGSLSLFLSILSGYKLFLFAQAQKGLKLNISQVCLACEVLTNILRFLWAAIDPFHGARKVLTWGFLRWLFSSHLAINSISLILIGFYWSDLVNTTSGAKSAFLQKPQTKAAAVIVTLVIFFLEIFSAVQDAGYLSGQLTLISACIYMVNFLFVGTWFFRCASKLVKALKSGGKGSDASVKKVTYRIYTIAALQHLNWMNMLALAFLGSTNDKLYFLFWSLYVLFMGIGSYLQIGVFNPPQWKAKMSELKEKTRMSKNFSASSVAVSDA